MLSCPVCESPETLVLPAPHARRSMVSNGRVMAAALERAACGTCGHGFHARALTAEDRDQLYDESYDLGLHDAAADEARAANYASLITEFIDKNKPGYRRPGLSIVEYGCGSGVLLDRLAQRWHAAPSLGIEAASGLVEAAEARGLKNVEIRQGFAETVAASVTQHDLCLSVNVVEHALDPVLFLEACRTSTEPGGIIVTICPNGELPGTELLFRDHVSSFTAGSFATVAARAGLQVIASEALSGRHSGFSIHLLQRGPPSKLEGTTCAAGLAEQRLRYLLGWRELESAVLRGVGTRPFAIFGTGEFADLLHAYCPAITNRAQHYVVERPVQSMRDGRSVLDMAQFQEMPMLLLAAVHPRNWQLLRDRLGPDAHHLIHPYQFGTLGSDL